MLYKVMSETHEFGFMEEHVVIHVVLLMGIRRNGNHDILLNSADSCKHELSVLIV